MHNSLAITIVVYVYDYTLYNVVKKRATEKVPNFKITSTLFL